MSLDIALRDGGGNYYKTRAHRSSFRLGPKPNISYRTNVNLSNLDEWKYRRLHGNPASVVFEEDAVFVEDEDDVTILAILKQWASNHPDGTWSVL